MTAASQLQRREHLVEKQDESTNRTYNSQIKLGFEVLLVRVKHCFDKNPLPSKQRNRVEWLSAFQLVHDSVCLHRGLLNWFRNRLEMVLLLYTSHNSTSHQSLAIIYLDDDVSIRLCQPLTAALWIVVLGGWALLTNTTTKGSHWLEWAKASIEARQFIRWLLIQNTQRQAYRHTHKHTLFLQISFTLTLILTQTNTQFYRSNKFRQQRRRKKTELGWGECVCQLFFTSFSVSSKVWKAHKV